MVNKKAFTGDLTLGKIEFIKNSICSLENNY
jgi:hypothetical protein